MTSEGHRGWQGHVPASDDLEAHGDLDLVACLETAERLQEEVNQRMRSDGDSPPENAAWVEHVIEMMSSSEVTSPEEMIQSAGKMLPPQHEVTTSGDEVEVLSASANIQDCSYYSFGQDKQPAVKTRNINFGNMENVPTDNSTRFSRFPFQTFAPSRISTQASSAADDTQFEMLHPASLLTNTADPTTLAVSSSFAASLPCAGQSAVTSDIPGDSVTSGTPKTHWKMSHVPGQTGTCDVPETTNVSAQFGLSGDVPMISHVTRQSEMPDVTGTSDVIAGHPGMFDIAKTLDVPGLFGMGGVPRIHDFSVQSVMRDYLGTRDEPGPSERSDISDMSDVPGQRETSPFSRRIDVPRMNSEVSMQSEQRGIPRIHEISGQSETCDTVRMTSVTHQSVTSNVFGQSVTGDVHTWCDSSRGQCGLHEGPDHSTIPHPQGPSEMSQMPGASGLMATHVPSSPQNSSNMIYTKCRNGPWAHNSQVTASSSTATSTGRVLGNVAAKSETPPPRLHPRSRAASSSQDSDGPLENIPRSLSSSSSSLTQSMEEDDRDMDDTVRILEKKEKNRLAAQKSRDKARNMKERLEKDVSRLEEKQAKLKEEIDKLQDERETLQTIISVHSVVCPLNIKTYSP